MVPTKAKYLKLLGNGELKDKATITVDFISASAKAKLEASSSTLTITSSA